MYLRFNVEKRKLIADLVGELDHHSAEEVRAKIDDRIEREDIDTVILDFRGVSFMDSSGIGVVVGRYKKIASRGGNLFIVDINRNIKKVFELSGLFKIIKCYDTLDDALSSI